MKITVNRDPFLVALSRARLTSAGLSVPPICNTIALESDGDRLMVRGTNLETSVSTSCPVESMESPFARAVDAEKLVGIVRESNPGASITLSCKSSDRVTISSGRARCRLEQTVGIDHFPTIPCPSETGARIEFQSDTLGSMLDKVRRSLSTDGTRPALEGVLIGLDGQQSIMVATDTHRMSVTRREAPSISTGPITMTVPRKSVVELKRLLSSVTEAHRVIMTADERHVRFDTGETKLTATLINLRFPASWPNILKSADSGSSVRVDVPHETLLRSLNLVSTVRDANAPPSINLYMDGGALMIRSRSKQESAVQAVDEATLDGDMHPITLNARFLLDILSSMDGGNVRISLPPGEMKPAKIIDPDDQSTVHILMPMRV